MNKASLAFTPSSPRQPPLEMHCANKGVRAGQQCHQCPCPFWREVILQEMELLWTFTQRTSRPTVPLTATFSSHTSSQPLEAPKDQGPTAQPPKGARVPGQECRFIQCWCWNTREASFGPSISVVSSHEQTSKQILKATLKSDVCLWTAKTGTFLTTNPSLNCNKLSKECRIDTSFLHSNSPVLALQHCWVLMKPAETLSGNPFSLSRVCKNTAEKMCVR